MRVHSDEQIKRLKALRRRGYSINEIVAELSIPKTTVWHHIQTVEVLPQYVSRLHSKRGGSTRRSEIRWEKARNEARQLIQEQNREFLIAITMLYWGEGSKKTFEFINSDGKMIELYLAIVRRVLKIPEERIKPTIRVFTGMNPKMCLDYWAHITKIPKGRFFFRMNDGGTRGRTQYGLCRITILRGSNDLKLMKSLVGQVADDLIKTSLHI